MKKDWDTQEQSDMFDKFLDDTSDSRTQTWKGWHGRRAHGYDELEWAMIEDKNGKTVSDFSGREREAFSIYKRLNTVNQHKMNPIPVCLIPKEYK